MNIKTQRLLSCGLAGINTLGLIGTFIFVIKDTKKAEKYPKVEMCKENRWR